MVLLFGHTFGKGVCEMGYCSCSANPKQGKGTRYYFLILCYVDDLLVVHYNPSHVGQDYQLSPTEA